MFNCKGFGESKLPFKLILDFKPDQKTTQITSQMMNKFLNFTDKAAESLCFS